MKSRMGFVSNSSSSSFAIQLRYLSPYQIESIQNHIEVGRRMGDFWCEDGAEWSISIDDEKISGYTIIDNFDMGLFLSRIGVPEEYIEWDD